MIADAKGMLLVHVNRFPFLALLAVSVFIFVKTMMVHLHERRIVLRNINVSLGYVLFLGDNSYAKMHSQVHVLIYTGKRYVLIGIGF